jgi:SOS-response transcriptional repressor LexA
MFLTLTAYYAPLQFESMNKAFQAAGKQKVKDNFSKVQRKNVERWTSGSEEAAQAFRYVHMSYSKCRVEVNDFLDLHF